VAPNGFVEVVLPKGFVPAAPVAADAVVAAGAAAGKLPPPKGFFDAAAFPAAIPGKLGAIEAAGAAVADGRAEVKEETLVAEGFAVLVEGADGAPPNGLLATAGALNDVDGAVKAFAVLGAAGVTPDVVVVAMPAVKEVEALAGNEMAAPPAG
jgi:hypothetical protein